MRSTHPLTKRFLYLCGSTSTLRCCILDARVHYPFPDSFLPIGMSAPASIPLSRPSITSHEREAVAAVMQSPRLSMGPALERFERQMAARCGTDHAIGVSSGTAALHCIVRALDLPKGGEVITTPYSFVASSNVLLFEDLVPRFVDIDPATYNIDPARVEAAITPNTCAILAVDVFGRPAPWPRLREIADAHDLALIADSCEALGASIGGTPIGAWGDAAGFGFYPNKQITTGEGGCITTNNAALAETCRSLRNQGRATRGQMRHVRLGYNYRLSELNAALGAAQLDRLDAILKARTCASAWYHDALAPLADALRRPPQTLPDAERSWFVYVIELRPPWTRTHRDALCDALQADSIGCAPYFPAIHLQPLYRERFGFQEGAFPHCESVAARTLALPFFADITESQIRRVVDALHTHLPKCAPESATTPLPVS